MPKIIPFITESKYRTYFLVLIVICSSNLLFGKSDFIPINTYPNDIANSKNFIWIAGNGGLFRLDKETDELMQFNPTNSGFPSYRSHYATVDKNGLIWSGINDKGLVSFDEKFWNFYDEDNTVIEELMFPKLYSGEDSKTWLLNYEAASNTNIYRFDGEKWEFIFEAKVSDGYSHINCFAAERKDMFWFGESNFIRKYERGVITTFTSSNTDLFPGPINDIAIDKMNRKWFAFNTGFVVNDWNVWQKYNMENCTIESEKITCIDRDKNGNMWLGTGAGITKYDGENWRNYSISTLDLSTHPIRKIIADGEQIWALCDNSPIYKFDGSSWIELNHTSSILSFGIVPSHTSEDIDWSLWVVFSADIIVKFNEKKKIANQFKLNKYVDVPNSASVLQFNIDENGTKWFATSEGLIKFDNQNWTLFDTNNTDLTSHYIRSFDFDSKGGIWLATEKEFAWFDGTDFVTMSYELSGLKTKCEFVSVDKDDKKWFLCDSTVMTYDGTNWEKFNYRRLGMTLEPRKMFVDSNNVKYFLWYVGYSTFDGAKWTHVRTEAKKPGANINYGGIDRKNNFWLASWSGLYKKLGSDYKEYNENNSSYEKSTIYSFGIGKSGRKYIGTEQGIAIIDDNDIEDENTISAEKMMFLVFNPISKNNDREIDAGQYYEIMPGYKELGRARPAVIFRNVSKNKNIQFYAGVEIHGKYSGEYLFRKDVVVDSAALADYKKSNIYLCDSLGNRIDFKFSPIPPAVPPGWYVKVIFDDFRLEKEYSGDKVVEVSVFSKNLSFPENEKFQLEDVSDDRISSDLHIVMNTFMVGGFVKSKQVKGKSVPDNSWWITKGVESVNAEQNTWFPHNGMSSYWDSLGNYHDGGLPNQYVYRMNRVNHANQEYQTGKKGGDELISHIIDFRKRYGTVFHVGLQRTGKDNINFNTDWAGSQLAMGMLYGPEHRVVTVKGTDTSEAREPDKIRFDFIAADAAHLEKLLNPSEEDWQTYYYHKMKDTSKGSSAFTLFGGGGSSSILINPYYDSIIAEKQGTINDIYDTGKDFEFKNYFVRLPDYLFNDSTFLRFRIKVDAKDDGLNNAIIDDKDDFYIETIDLFPPTEGIDLCINSAKVIQHYATYPLNENISLPVKFSIQNLTYMDAPGMLLYVKINPETDSLFDDDLNKYRRYVQLPFMRPIQTIISDLPAFKPYEIESIRNQLKPGINKFKMQAYIAVPGGDIWIDNDTIYSEFSIYLDSCLSYEIPGTGNPLDVLSGVPFKGLYLHGVSGKENYWAEQFSEEEASGQLAVKFTLESKDTVFALQTNWNRLSSAYDDITFSIYKDSNNLPGEMISESLTKSQKCWDDYKQSFYIGEWVSNVFKKPVILEKGTYWAAVAQLGETAFQLDASLHRMGMLTTLIDSANRGEGNKTLLIDKNIRESIAAYENSYGSGSWVPFTPETGNPAYPFRDMYGTIGSGSERIRTYTRGTVIPKIRISFDGSHYKPDAVEENGISSGEFEINPNPATDFIEISYSPSQMSFLRMQESDQLSSSIKIYNVFGELLTTPALGATPPYKGGIIKVDVSTLPPGIYFVRVGDKMQKFIKI